MIEVEAKALKAALRGIGAVVERRNTIPVLANVLLSGSAKVLRLTGTDLDIQIERSIAVDGKGAIHTTVGAGVLSAIVGKMPAEGIIRIEHDAAKGVVKLSCGRSKFTLATLPPDDFPVMPAPGEATQFSLTAVQLREIIDSVRFAVSTEETRHYLNGVFLHAADGETMKAAATDGHRLAVISFPLPDGAAEMEDIILPRKTADVLRGLIDRSDQAVEIAVAARKIVFRVHDDVLTSSLIDGTFPDYTRVIPHGNDKRLAIDPATLTGAIERVTTIATEKTRAVKVELGRDKVTLVVSCPETGSSTEELPADYSAAGLELGFNARYLLDMLKRLPGDAIEVLFGEANSPTLFRTSEAAPAQYVLMPMRV